MNIDIINMVVALMDNLDISSREAVGPLGNLHHEDRVAEVNEGERLDRDDCSSSMGHHVMRHVLKVLCLVNLDLQPTGEVELTRCLPFQVHEAISQDSRGLGQSNIHHFHFVLS